MSTKVSAEELRTMFHLAVEDLKNPPRQRNGLVELPGSDIGYPVDKICAALLNTDAACGHAPGWVKAALGLPVGATYAAAADVVLAEFNKPFPPMTDEVIAQEEMSLREMSAAIESVNERNPDAAQMPVVYPKETRRPQ